MLVVSVIYSSLLMKEFQVVKQLGCGSFGRVLQVHPIDNPAQLLAVKQIKMSLLGPKERDNAVNEVRLLASIRSPHVVSYHRAFFEQHDNSLYIIMEYADGGDLAGLIKKKREKKEKFNEPFIWHVAYHILQGLKILHQKNIIHRDIKPANVFMVEGVAKIGDLNVSKVLEGKYASTQTGTPYYTSPQIWNNNKYDGKVDVWSLGCLLYELATLRLPFTGKDLATLSRKVTSGLFEPIAPNSYSSKLTDLIKSCLIVKMLDRPTASTLLKMDVFKEMQSGGEGEIELLDTIKCPKELRQLQFQLPEKKAASFKCLEPLEGKEGKDGVKSHKKVASCKSIGTGSCKSIGLGNLMTPSKGVKKEKENEKIAENLKNLLAQGLLKLPPLIFQKQP